jgi:hypothetical protein
MSFHIVLDSEEGIAEMSIIKMSASEDHTSMNYVIESETLGVVVIEYFKDQPESTRVFTGVPPTA